MLSAIRTRIGNFFDLSGRQSTISTEILAGITTFLSIMYIFVVNPAILVAPAYP